jgi:N-acetylmuramoyl-L-alanine amidase
VLVALAPLALCLLGAERPKGLGDVVDVRHWSYPDYTRVVVEFSAPVTSAVRHLPADGKAKRPERLYLDVEGVWVGRRYLDGIPVGDGLLQAVRLGQNTLTTTRVVIDVERYERHRLLTLSHPDRLVVDVYGPREGAETLRWPRREKPGERSRARLPTEMRPVQTLVIDPGHGGRDPGAIGVGGLREKDITLRLAKALREKAEAKGFRVVVTREGDRTIDLEERTAMAEAAGGDVFISLHTNAAPRGAAHGVETYYLDANHERHSIDVAARENGIEPSQVNALQRTLARLRVSETSVHSRRLAALVQDQIVVGVDGRYGDVHDLGVKKGPFYVLFLSNMPAVLVEVGFITNRKEARLLRDGDYLEELAEQITAALVRYREGLSVLARRTGL